MVDNKYYDKGDKVRLHATFKVNQGLTDPDTITLKLKNPDDLELIFTLAGGEVVRGSQGYYYHDYIIPLDVTAGAWYYRFDSTGVKSAAEKTFIVKPSHFD